MGQRSPSARPLFPVAPPVDSLSAVRVIVFLSPSHTSWANVVRYDLAVFGEPFLTEGADAILFCNLSVYQLPHLGVRTDLPISARVKQRLFLLSCGRGISKYADRSAECPGLKSYRNVTTLSCYLLKLRLLWNLIENGVPSSLTSQSKWKGNAQVIVSPTERRI